MNEYEKFNLAVEKFKALEPSMFDNPFLEEVSTENEIATVEKALEVKFPEELNYLLLNYPAGNFGYSLIYSVKDNSHDNIVKMNRQCPYEGFLLFSDNGCGDNYGFKVENNQCLPEVYFHDHEIDKWIKTEYENLFQFLYVYAFKM